MTSTPPPSLYAEQAAMIAGIRSTYAQGHRRILQQSPTGSGKGEMAAYLLAAAARKKTPTLFISPLDILTTDIAQRCAKWGVDRVSVLHGDNTRNDPQALITIASPWTMVERNHFPPARFIVVDECRIIVCNTYNTIASAYPESTQWLGFDATPERADGTPLGDAFDVLLQGPSIESLVNLGRLAPVRIYGPSEEVDQLAQDPVDLYDPSRTAANDWPNALDPSGRPLPSIIFAATLAHSRDIAARLRALGHSAVHCDGETPDRASIIDRFNAGEIDVLCNRGLFTQALDLKRRVQHICLAKRFAHAGPYMQAIGRARRPHDGITIIHDLRGNFHRPGLGHPDMHRSYHLDGRPIRILEELPAVTQCRGCHAWGPPRSRCRTPGCGYVHPPPPPPRVSKRELQELRQDRIPREGEEWEAFAALVQTGRERGYKAQWAPLQFEKRFGRFPRWRSDLVPADWLPPAREAGAA
jgi:DNA repair protein RadD